MIPAPANNRNRAPSKDRDALIAALIRVSASPSVIESRGALQLCKVLAARLSKGEVRECRRAAKVAVAVFKLIGRSAEPFNITTHEL